MQVMHFQHFSEWSLAVWSGDEAPQSARALQMSGWLSRDCRGAVECIPPSSEVGSAARLVVPGPQLRTQRRAVERPPAALTPPPPRTPALPAPPRPATCAQLCLWPHIGRTALSGDLNTERRGGVTRETSELAATRHTAPPWRTSSASSGTTTSSRSPPPSSTSSRRRSSWT